MRVVVRPHDPRWAQAYEAERGRITGILGTDAVAVHHVGSTAIPGICAKPIIDILVELSGLGAADAAAPRMAAAGYEALGEFGLPGRRYFRRNDAAGTRTHHVHAYEAGSAEIARHLAFRDYLRARPAKAAGYSALKERLAAAHPHDIEAYMDGKDALVKSLEAEALAWRAAGR